MKKTLLLLFASLLFNHVSFSQGLSAKERAELIAQESFSKSKYMKKEKYGITKELNRVIVSTPVIQQNTADYSGVYKAYGFDCTLILNIEDDQKIQATLKENDGNKSSAFSLKQITIKDALFKAIQVDADGSETPLEGVFINKNDNGRTEFGLGIKLSKSITKDDALQIDKLFFKKVD
jgi:hypothetical protein